MGFLKGFGKGLGQAVGTVTGEPIKWVGKKVSENLDESAGKWIQDVGKGVKSSTEFAGERLGETASGVYGLAEGTIKKDPLKQSQAFDELYDGVGKTVKGVGHTIKHTAGSVGDVAGGLMDGDERRWKQGLRNVSTTAAVGVLGVSVLDAADVIDVNGNEGGIDSVEKNPSPNIAASETTVVDNPNSHHVEPHYVESHMRGGQWIEGYWRDGDGDTSVNTSEGWNQDNPDYRAPVAEDTPDVAVKESATEYNQVDNQNSHHVEAHYVEGHWRGDQWIEGYWRDGDGDTSVDTNGGWNQSNPNYRIPVDKA